MREKGKKSKMIQSETAKELELLQAKMRENGANGFGRRRLLDLEGKK